MNDELREKLSAYLDGALSEMDRKDVEERIARDEETRLELEALRAVSSAVKGLGREPLPGGFMARLQSRILREGSDTKRDWVFLPPALRPVAAIMSMAVVALVVWDKAHTPVEQAITGAAWDGTNDRAMVKTAAEAPTSMDVSGRVAALNSGAPSEYAAKKEDSADKLEIAPAGKRAAAPGKPLEVAEDDNRDQGLAGFKGMAGGGAGAAAGPGAAAAPSPAAPTSVFEKSAAEGGSFVARSEEERSAINERLYKTLEDEKKSMGIVRIVEKDSEDQPARERGDVMTLTASPEPSRLNRAGAMRGAAQGDKLGSLSKSKARAKDAAPVAVKAITLKSSEALAAAWGAAGLPGEPPAVDFPRQMALFLAGPRGCGITAVQNRKKFIVVLYKDSGMDDASRVRAVASSAKPAVVKLAE